jgi:molybdopterin-binding protein
LEVGYESCCRNRRYAEKVLNIKAMPNANHMLTPREAAHLIGISYPTIKQWILAGKLKTVQTPGGHHRIAESTLKPFLVKDSAKPAKESRERYRRVSGRNQLAGKIVNIRIEGLLAEVVLAMGNTHITAIITANAVRELQLKKGDTAAALIKSTDVMIERLEDPS